MKFTLLRDYIVSSKSILYSIVSLWLVLNSIIVVFATDVLSDYFYRESIHSYSSNLIMYAKRSIQEGDYIKFASFAKNVQFPFGKLVDVKFFSNLDGSSPTNDVGRVCGNSAIIQQSGFYVYCSDVSGVSLELYIRPRRGFVWGSPFIIFGLAIIIFGAFGFGFILNTILRKYLDSIFSSVAESIHSGKPSRALRTAFPEATVAIEEILQLVKTQSEKIKENSKYKATVKLSRAVAHDIRSPLGALRVLAEDSDELSDNKKRLLISASERIKIIADDLLSRSTSSHLDVTATFVDLEIRQLLAEKEFEIKKKNISLVEDIQYGVFADVNGSYLKRILSNLINNSIEAGAKNIKIKLSVSDTNLALIISDDGEGFPPSFFDGRTVAEVPTKGGGYGIGLSSARKAVESWSGSLVIAMGQEKGAVVKVLVPTCRRPDWFLFKIDLSRCVVLVDDDFVFAEMVRKVLPVECQFVHFQSIDDFMTEGGGASEHIALVSSSLPDFDLRRLEAFRNRPVAILIDNDFEQVVEGVSNLQMSDIKLIPKLSLERVLINSRTGP